MSDVCDNRVTCINVYQVACISFQFIDYCYINAVFDVPNIFVLKYLVMRCNARGFTNFARVQCELRIPRYKVWLHNTPVAINIYNLVGCTNGTKVLNDTTHTELQRRVRTLFQHSQNINTVEKVVTHL